MPGLHRLDKVGNSSQKENGFEDFYSAPGRISDLRGSSSARRPEGCGMDDTAVRTSSNWFDNHSWQPNSSPEPASKETESAVDEIPQADDAPQPGSKEYLSLGCDYLWIDIGGECG